MFDLIVIEPFHQRADDSGAITIRSTGDRIKGADMVDAVLSGPHRNYVVKVPAEIDDTPAETDETPAPADVKKPVFVAAPADPIKL